MFDSGLKTFDVGTGVLFFPQKKVNKHQTYRSFLLFFRCQHAVQQKSHNASHNASRKWIKLDSVTKASTKMDYPLVMTMT